MNDDDLPQSHRGVHDAIGRFAALALPQDARVVDDCAVDLS